MTIVYRILENDLLWNNVKVKNKILPFHDFLENILRTGSIRPSLENPPFYGKFPRPPFLNFLQALTLKFFG